MRPKRRILLYLATLLPDLIGWLALLTLRPLHGHKLRWQKGALTLELDALSFMSQLRTLPDANEDGVREPWGAITLAPHAILFNYAEMDSLTHELRHVEQYESAAIACALITGMLFFTALPWWQALLPSFCGPWIIMFAAYVTAYLRGEPFYRGAHTEEAAYGGQNDANKKS